MTQLPKRPNHGNRGRPCPGVQWVEASRAGCDLQISCAACGFGRELKKEATPLRLAPELEDFLSDPLTCLGGVCHSDASSKI